MDFDENQAKWLIFDTNSAEYVKSVTIKIEKSIFYLYKSANFHSRF